MNEKQQHFQAAFQKQQELIGEINKLNDELNRKREEVIKIQGILEYLDQNGGNPNKDKEESATEVVSNPFQK